MILKYVLKKHSLKFYLASTILFLFGGAGIYLSNTDGMQLGKHEFLVTGLCFFIGIVVPIFIFRQIKCPICNHHFYWDYLNRAGSADSCSKCGNRFE